MKKLLIGFLALISISTFANTLSCSGFDSTGGSSKLISLSMPLTTDYNVGGTSAEIKFNSIDGRFSIEVLARTYGNPDKGDIAVYVTGNTSGAVQSSMFNSRLASIVLNTPKRLPLSLECRIK